MCPHKGIFSDKRNKTIGTLGHMNKALYGVTEPSARVQMLWLHLSLPFLDVCVTAGIRGHPFLAGHQSQRSSRRSEREASS